MAPAELKVMNAAGKATGTREIPEAVRDAKQPKKGLVHEVVRWQRAKKRAGTHTVLTRAQASGGGAKPWKQKGTGRARAGSNTSPLWVGGGIAHGPKQRSYEFSLNKKQRKKALISALGAKITDGKIVIVDDFGITEAKTKKADALLRAVGVAAGSKAVVVIPKEQESARKSFRNLEDVKVLEPEGLNVYDIINSDFVVVANDAWEGLCGRLSS